MPLTLGHIMACRHYPDKEQLNAIITQVGSLTLPLVDAHNNDRCTDFERPFLHRKPGPTAYVSGLLRDLNRHQWPH